MERTTYLVPINQYDIDLHTDGMNSPREQSRVIVARR